MLQLVKFYHYINQRAHIDARQQDIFHSKPLSNNSSKFKNCTLLLKSVSLIPSGGVIVNAVTNPVGD